VDQPAVATSEARAAAPIEGGSIAWQAFKQMFARLLQSLKKLFSGRGA
jgi:hypothetical protein